jgi:hypothetical protein
LKEAEAKRAEEAVTPTAPPTTQITPSENQWFHFSSFCLWSKMTTDYIIQLWSYYFFFLSSLWIWEPNGVKVFK